MQATTTPNRTKRKLNRCFIDIPYLRTQWLHVREVVGIVDIVAHADRKLVVQAELQQQSSLKAGIVVIGQDHDPGFPGCSLPGGDAFHVINAAG